MSASVNAPCPCGSGTKYKRCCGVYHGGRPAPPEKLMPARYCAYAIGNAVYVMYTTHPDGPMFRTDRRAWKADIEAYCRSTHFVGLEIHEHHTPPDDAGDAFVSFTATLEHDGTALVQRERSRFRRDGTRWKYYDGE